MHPHTKNLFDVIFAFVQLAALVWAAVWTYFRFSREGTHKPRIEFDVKCTFYDPKDGIRGAFFEVIASNKGHVEHKFVSISLKVRGVKLDQPNERLPGGRWDFPERLLEAELVSAESEYFFVRPGINQPFSFPTTIPADCRQIWVRATFEYENSGEPHTIDRVFAIPSTAESLASTKPVLVESSASVGPVI